MNSRDQALYELMSERYDGLQANFDTLRASLGRVERRNEELALALEVARRERDEARSEIAEVIKHYGESDEDVTLATVVDYVFKNGDQGWRKAGEAEADRDTALAQAAGLRRDAERWRWAKWHPGIAVYVFDVEWMEQRDFDAAIDMEMQQADPIKPCTNCTRCLFDCRNGKWNLNGQEMDCFGCDGSGIEKTCEEHKEEDDDE